MRILRRFTLCLLVCGSSSWSQATGKTVLDGVFTEAQAKRGEAAYAMNCAGCHGEDLSGRAMGPLRGDRFLDRWREDGLDILFTHIRTRMPANAAGSLSEAAYLDILAYVLQVNGYPTGPQELTTAVVANTKLVGKNGPQPLPTNTLVQVVGCLTRQADDWVLIHAGEPVRTRNAENTTPEELKRAAALPLGAGTLRLQNLDELPGFRPDPWSGHKVQAKGVLIRQPNRDRINVLSVESASPACMP
ncbi:MAG TPA: cytochrome c [Bryobacteraceae bacterium]|jgi:cytochrome c5